MDNAKSRNVPLRVFVSSTYEDMVEYRRAVIDELTNIELIPRAMEHFVSSPNKPLDVVLAEVRRCQLFIALVAMRYGSIDPDTGKSFSELEYEEAMKNGIPVLAFVIDENECPVLPKFVDTGDKAEKLKIFKNALDTKYASRFKSIDHLKELVVRAVKKQINEVEATTTSLETLNEIDYMTGAEIFKRFLVLPGRHKNKEVYLRVRVNSKYSTWTLKEELFQAFDLKRDDSIHFDNGAYIVGVNYFDIKAGPEVDLFAEGKSADWLLDNGVTLGTVFEGTFKLAYESVSRITSTGKPVYMAALILIKGSSIIGRDDDFIATYVDNENSHREER